MTIPTTLAAGGIAVFALGILAARMRGFVTLLMRCCFVTVEVRNSESLFANVERWFNVEEFTRGSRALTAALRVAPATPRRESRSSYFGPISSMGIGQIAEADPRAALHFTPGSGEHIFWYGRRPLWVTRSVDTSSNTTDTRYRERFILRILTRDPAVARAVMEHIRRETTPLDVSTIGIFVSQSSDWMPLGERQPRSPDSVVLPGKTMVDLIADARRFLDGEEWYRSLGIPYRHGYLFHGPKGTGKSSAAVALAGELGLDLYVFNPSGGQLADDGMQYLFAQLPERAIVLLEDVDAAFVGREATGSFGAGGGITFSGLLNCLDGAYAAEGRILIMTTNHKDRLDEALIRDGRIDVTVGFGLATRSQVRMMYRRFFPNAGELDAEKFAADSRAETMAEVQRELRELVQKGPKSPPRQTWQPRRTIFDSPDTPVVYLPHRVRKITRTKKDERIGRRIRDEV